MVEKIPEKEKKFSFLESFFEKPLYKVEKVWYNNSEIRIGTVNGMGFEQETYLERIKKIKSSKKITKSYKKVTIKAGDKLKLAKSRVKQGREITLMPVWKKKNS